MPSGPAEVDGNLSVTGTLTKGSGTFKIDHPLDPANKYLSHSFVESPDMMNVYNGNVVTDASGEAVVELPDYFEALNRDPRYQLTVIGSLATALDRARRSSDNRFTIQTERAERGGLLAGHRHPPGRLCAGASDRRRGGEGGRRPWPLPAPGGARPACFASELVANHPCRTSRRAVGSDR